jgi:2'-5' RNA ligase
MTTSSTESALIIAVPEAEPLVKSFREHFDPSAAVGAPAHITILCPFKPPHEITPAVQVELRRLFAQFSAFEFVLAELGRFPRVLYLAPSPEDRFQSLMRAVYERYPETPRYGGAFSEVIPHLTIADVEQPMQLEMIEREFMELHGARLPVKACAQHVLLIDNTSGRWEVRQTFRLSR